MRLVFVTQTVDADDPNLGVAVDKVRALAARCDEVRVVCDRVLRHDLPSNVSFRTFDAATRLHRGTAFERSLADALRRPRPDAVLAHMVPLYVLLATPLARAHRVPILLWYAHWRGDWTLRLADRLCAATLSVDRGSYPLRSTKLHAIGHGIDVARFAAAEHVASPDGRPLTLVSLGRTAPWKGYSVLLDGFERALRDGLEARLEIRGPSTTPVEERHRAELARRIAGSDVLRSHATLEEPVAREAVPRLLSNADAFVTAADSGRGTQTLDKVVYEASACALPVVASNPALREYLAGLRLDLTFRPGDAADLAQALRRLAAAPLEVRAETGRELRRRAEAGHSVESWAERVLDVVASLRR